MINQCQHNNNNNNRKCFRCHTTKQILFLRIILFYIFSFIFFLFQSKSFNQQFIQSIRDDNHNHHDSTLLFIPTRTPSSHSNYTTLFVPDHPHAGARDVDGNWNYTPDVSFIHRNVLQQQLKNNSIILQLHDTNNRYFPLEIELMDKVCQVKPGHGEEGLDGYELLQFLQLNGPNPEPQPLILNQSNGSTELNMTTNVNDAFNIPTLAPTSDISNITSARILCVVYTYDQHHDQIRAIVETWGWRCDGFFAASTKTDSSIGAIDLPHRGEEKYKNMWQKTRSILAYMYDNYIDQYDYFYLAGDDGYVIVENLRNYLHLLESMEGGRDIRPLYFGHQVPWNYFVMNGGGAGYGLNRLALQRFVLEALPNCLVNDENAMEDVFVGKCFHKIGIYPIDTADAAHRQRFHGLHPNRVADKNPPTLDKWYINSMYNHWAKDHGWRHGMDLPSTQSITFHHLKTPESMKRIHAIIYNSCPEGTILYNAITNARSNNETQTSE